MKKLCVILLALLAAVTAFFGMLCSVGASTQDSLDEFYFKPSWNIYSGAARYMPEEQSVSFYSYLGNITATCTLESEMDLRYYGYFIFDLTVNEDSQISEPYSVELTLYSDYEASSYSQNVFPSSSSRITFDLSDFEHREQITYIGIRIVPVSREEGYMSFTISDVRLSGKVDKELSERYMCESYISDGADISYGSDGIELLINEDTVVRGDVTVVEPAEAPDVIRIVYSSEENIEGVTLTVRGEDGSVSRSQIAFKSVSEPQILLVPLSFKAMPSQISFSFQNAAGKELTLHSIEALSSYSGIHTSNGTSLSCYLQKDNSSYIVVSGSLPSEFANRRNSATLGLFELEPYRSIDSIYEGGVSPIATYPMSTKFEFRVPMQESNYLALFSKYAVVVCIDGAPSGDIVMMPRYIENISVSDDKPSAENAFKGIMTDNGVAAEQAGAGTVILDVYLDELISMKNIGQLHSVYSGYYYFTLSSVQELDRRIGSASVSGADVILRLLVRNNGESLPFAYDGESSDTLYRSMRADDWESMMYIHAVTDFLLSRYGGGDHGKVSGLIVGTKINEAALYNSMGDELALGEYVSRYISVLRVINASIVRRASSVKLYLPISGAWSETVAGSIESGRYDTPLLLYAVAEAVLREGGMPVSLVLESGIEGAAGEHLPSIIGADNIKTLQNELRSPLGAGAGFDSLMFMWKPTEQGDSQLKWDYCSAYGVLYQAGIDIFAMDLSGVELGAVSDTLLSFSYIDTKNLLVHLPSELGAFIYQDDQVVSTDGRLKYRAMREFAPYSFERALSYDVQGRYDYFDFTASYDSLGWYAGSGCLGLESSPSSSGKRTLEAQSNGDFSVYYIFDEREDMSMLSSLALDIKVKGEGEAMITLVLDSTERAEVSAIAEAGDIVTLYFDITQFDGSDIASIKLSVTGDRVEGAEFDRIYGLSSSLDDDALSYAILESRTKIDVGGIDLGLVVSIFASVALVLSLAGVIIVSLRAKKK